MSDIQSAGISTSTAGRHLAAAQTIASLAITTTPTVAVWPTVIQQAADTDSQYDPATGYWTFITDGFLNLTAQWFVTATGQALFYADIEYSVDGGTTWARGIDSCAAMQVNNSSSMTVKFEVKRFFSKGNMFRIVRWASTSNVTITTTTNNSSTISAGFVIASYIFGSKV